MLEGLAISENRPSTSGLSHDGVEEECAFDSLTSELHGSQDWLSEQR